MHDFIADRFYGREFEGMPQIPSPRTTDSRRALREPRAPSSAERSRVRCTEHCGAVSGAQGPGPSLRLDAASDTRPRRWPVEAPSLSGACPTRTAGRGRRYPSTPRGFVTAKRETDREALSKQQKRIDDPAGPYFPGHKWGGSDYRGQSKTVPRRDRHSAHGVTASCVAPSP